MSVSIVLQINLITVVQIHSTFISMQGQNIDVPSSQMYWKLLTSKSFATWKYMCTHCFHLLSVWWFEWCFLEAILHKGSVRSLSLLHNHYVTKPAMLLSCHTSQKETAALTSGHTVDDLRLWSGTSTVMYYSSAADLTLLTQFTPEEMYVFSDNVGKITFTKDEDKSVASPILSFWNYLVITLT